MQADAQRRKTARALDGVVGCGRGHHQAGGGEDPLTVPAFDGLVHGNRQAEVVGRHDELAHGTLMRSMGRAPCSQAGFVERSEAAHMPESGTPSRKADYVRITLERDVAAKGVTGGFEAYRLLHCALPEIDLREVDTACELFGRPLQAPLLISCMTGGTPQARAINQVLAQVAQTHGLAMGLGSARAARRCEPAGNVRRARRGAGRTAACESR